MFSGKVELGTGVSTALRQIVAEELDFPIERITWVQGDSDRTVDQGPTVGSQTVKRGGAQLRQAAAEARAALLDLAVRASTHRLDRGDCCRRRVGNRRGGSPRIWRAHRRPTLERTVSGSAKTKSPSNYTVVGQPIPRAELPAKMTGRHVYVHDVDVDGMLHGRVVRPASIGARVVAVDDRALRQIRGARVLRKGDFVGVVAECEEDVIRAAGALEVTWSVRHASGHGRAPTRS